MNKISKRNAVLLVLCSALLFSSSTALGREGRGHSFMRAFGMTVKTDDIAQSYQDWSRKLAGMTGETGSVGPVLAQGEGGNGVGFSFGFGNAIGGQAGWLSSLFSFGTSISTLNVGVNTPYSYRGYRGYR